MSYARRHRKPRLPSALVSIDAGGHRAKVLAARDALVEAHLHLVPPIAHRLHRALPPSFDIDDLLAVGNLALIHVATRYRPLEHGGTPFSAFARPRIRGAILDSVRRRNYAEHTMLPLDGETSQVCEDAATIEISIDEGRLKQRLRAAIEELPDHQRAIVSAYYAEHLVRELRNPTGRFQRLDHLACVGSALGLPEWRVILEHAEAIAELRRKLAA